MTSSFNSNDDEEAVVANDNLAPVPPPLAVSFENVGDLDDNESDQDEFFDQDEDDNNDGDDDDIMDEIEDEDEDMDEDDDFNDDYSESTTSECAIFLVTSDRYDYPPKKVSRATVDPSVKEMKHTFERCKRLTSVQLSEGLERIGNSTFEGCESLYQIKIPSSVKVIGPHAFSCCRRLESVELCEGLEVIEGSAFAECFSLQSITIPSKIKSINRAAFECCTQLRYVTLPDGLEYIGDRAFASCLSLTHIEIPSTVKEISPEAFSCSSNLTVVRFCEEIEGFVSGESLRGWWDKGISKYSLKTYSFLARRNVPARVGALTRVKWQANIHDMLKRIPSFGFDDLDVYFNSIDSKLTTYESLPDSIPLLDLAIWKSKILEHDPNIENVGIMMKLQCRNNCGTSVIVPNVLSFILED